MSDTQKRKFRAPTSGDPQEIEKAFELLNKKIEEITVKLDEALAAQTSTQDTAVDENDAAIAANTTQIAVNKADITTNAAANTAAIAASELALAVDYDAKVALKVGIDAALADIGTLNGAQTVYTFGSPSGDVSEDDWNDDIAPSIDTAYTNIADDIADCKTKINAICAIIRDD